MDPPGISSWITTASAFTARGISHVTSICHVLVACQIQYVTFQRLVIRVVHIHNRFNTKSSRYSYKKFCQKSCITYGKEIKGTYYYSGYRSLKQIARCPLPSQDFFLTGRIGGFIWRTILYEPAVQTVIYTRPLVLQKLEMAGKSWKNPDIWSLKLNLPSIWLKNLLLMKLTSLFWKEIANFGNKFKLSLMVWLATVNQILSS